MSSQLRHVLTIGKKLVKQQYLLHMSPQYGELWPTSYKNNYNKNSNMKKSEKIKEVGSGEGLASSSGKER